MNRTDAHRRSCSRLIGRTIRSVSYDTVVGRFHRAVDLVLDDGTLAAITCFDVPGFRYDRFSVSLDVSAARSLPSSSASHPERSESLHITRVAVVDFDEWREHDGERSGLEGGPEFRFTAGPLGSAPASFDVVRQCMGVAFFDDARGTMLYFRKGAYYCSVEEITDQRVFDSDDTEFAATWIS